MRRIRNIFGWTCLKDWIAAEEKGFINITENKYFEGNAELDNDILFLLENDCFPKSIVCVKKGSDYYAMLMQCEIDLFRFIRNEAAFQGDNGFCFSDLPGDKKQKILNARIDSIWLEIDDE